MPREQPPRSRQAETSLYAPVKRYLETLGFTVKGEVCGCDLVALREGELPIVIIGELKLSFTLDLVLQAVDRTAACDEVWLQLVQQPEDACAIRVCASFVVSLVLAYSGYYQMALSKF